VEALARLMKDEFALVLLDVSMPGMDGFETAAMIHDHPRFERTPIIFITGVHDTEFDRLKGYKLGAVDYVSIPVVPEILRSKVSGAGRAALPAPGAAEAQSQSRRCERAARAGQHDVAGGEDARARALNQHLQKANTELAASNQALQAEIAERARAEAALLEADRHKDEFLAILAHELRNPLAPIRNAVEIMSRFRSRTRS
jgi:CheY-like chemotaxis protein